MGRSELSSKIRILQQGCDPSAADDTSLPYTTYLVEYLQDGMTKFDIVIANKKVDVFDYYWDLYRHDFVTFSQTNGRINPKLWNDPSKKKKK